jgi:hypothetical protein
MAIILYSTALASSDSESTITLMMRLARPGRMGAEKVWERTRPRRFAPGHRVLSADLGRPRQRTSSLSRPAAAAGAARKLARPVHRPGHSV